MYRLQLYVLPNLCFQGSDECYAAMIPSSVVQEPLPTRIEKQRRYKCKDLNEYNPTNYTDH